MPNWDESLIDLHRRKLQDLRRRAAEALQQLGDEDVNWRPNEQSNSVANLVVHVAGNLRQRVASGIGGAADTRDRDAEFSARLYLTRDRLLEVLNEAFAEADRTLGAMTPAQLQDPQRLHNREVTVLEVLFMVANHISEHVGQILYAAKLRRGPVYRTLSTPHRPR